MSPTKVNYQNLTCNLAGTRWCQSNANQSPKHLKLRRSGCQLAPFGHGGGAVLFEGFAAVQVTIEVEMIVDRGMDGGKFLQGLYIPEPCHRTLSSPERLVRIFGTIVKPAPTLLNSGIANNVHRRPVRPEPVGHDHLWLTVPLHRTLQKFKC